MNALNVAFAVLMAPLVAYALLVVVGLLLACPPLVLGGLTLGAVVAHVASR